MSEELSEKKQGILKEQEDKVEELGKEHIDSQTQKEFLKEQGIEVEEPDDQHINQFIAKIQREYSGPIPPPNIIKGYEQVLPGSADRILKMAEKQSEHRQNMESKMIHAESRDSLLGILFAFILGIGCIIASITMVVVVPQNAGAISGALIGVTGIGSIIVAFIKSTRGRYSNSEK
nr:DUF2335 domain-containing protein [uncultured Schaedlerella sp.]